MTLTAPAYTAAAPPTALDQAALRRLDWRFLLPLPPGGVYPHLLLLGGSPEQAQLCNALGLAPMVNTTARSDVPADAVALLRGAPQTLADVTPALRPGAALYAELPSRWARDLTVGHVRRRLARLGLTMTGLYAAWPDLATAQAYWPLDNPALLAWYFRVMSDSLPQLTRPYAWWARLRPRLLWPFRDVVVTAIKGDPAGAPLAASLPLAADHASAPLLLTPGDDHINRVVAFVGGAPGQPPAAVLKFWRLPNQNAITEFEQRHLTALRGSLPPDLRRALPEPLGSYPWGGLTVGAETCAPGRPLDAGRRVQSLARRLTDLRRVAAWLTRFHTQGAIDRRPWSAAELTEWVERPLAAYTAAVPPTPALAALFDRTRVAAAQLVGRPIPTVWVHWGFSDRNLFWSEAGLTVIDWEAASHGPPLYDLLYYTLQWYWRTRRAWDAPAQRRAFSRLFVSPPSADPAAVAVHAVLADYLAAIQLHRRCLPVFLVLQLVERVLGHLQRVEGVVPDLSNDAYAACLAELAAHPAAVFGEAADV